MFAVFQEEIIITVCIGVFFLLSILCKMILGRIYRHLIQETDNMATTGNKLLKQCKLKFTNCYQMNKGVPNIPVFVDKFLSRLTVGPVSFDLLEHLSGQLMLLSVVFCGIGVCKSIIDGHMLGEILPFYAAALLELYLYFSLSAIADIKSYRRVLKINLVDYLENHLSARISVTDKDIEMLYGTEVQPVPAAGKEGKAAKGETWAIREGRMADVRSERKRVVQEAAATGQAEGLTGDQEKELETLLAEFLTS